jgi:hypothetical protein
MLSPLADPRRQFRQLQKFADSMLDRAFNPRVSFFLLIHTHFVFVKNKNKKMVAWHAADAAQSRIAPKM